MSNSWRYSNGIKIFVSIFMRSVLDQQVRRSWVHGFGFACLCVPLWVVCMYICLTPTRTSTLHKCLRQGPQVRLCGCIGVDPGQQPKPRASSSSATTQRAQCAPPAPTIWPMHCMSASVSATGQNTSVWFPPGAATLPQPGAPFVPTLNKT